MKSCEYCQNQHNGSYGSGRFCSKGCSKGFSTKSKRADINKIISQKLKSRGGTSGGFKKGDDSRRFVFNEELNKKISIDKLNQYVNFAWDKLPKAEKRRRILLEQDNKCGTCYLEKWLEKEITLELHHINGNNKDNSRINLIFLCPNCHSQTDNFRNRKRNADMGG